MTSDLRPQRRGRKIAMTADEVDAFLAGERTCRVATNSADGPHVSPLWFVWQSGALWVYSLNRSQRWKDVHADPRISVVIDAGHEYFELRGVEISGTAAPVGEVPRVGEPNDELVAVERHFAGKYLAGDEMFYDGKHGWLKTIPAKIASWDFRKIGSLS